MRPEALDQNVSAATLSHISNEHGKLDNTIEPKMPYRTLGKDTCQENSQTESSESDLEEDGDVDGHSESENDIEVIEIVSLFDDSVFNDVPSMLEYVRSSYDFDMAAIQKQLGLDLLETIKLVNFIRQEVKEGRGRALDISSKEVFEDDRYLQPVLEDDALLYSLEDIIQDGPGRIPDSTATSPLLSGVDLKGEAYVKINELQQSLLQAQQLVYATQQRLDLTERALNVAREADTKPIAQAQSSTTQSDYAGNYDGAELHREMIADTARTQAYRNFILNNSHIFKDKVVLDVGCGTGILSLFCADAGAKVVYAVDQSEKIIKKAHEIVIHNGKQDTVKLIQGRIQDIHLPVRKVDVVVSEWMGYCLFFEAMFDSVIWARDRYLKPDGIMIPAQSTLYVAPFCNLKYRRSRIEFWDDVYGYDMSCFKPGVLQTIAEDTSLDSSHLVSAKSAFQSFDHYKAKVADLSFRDAPISFKLNRDISQQLDGFAIWFDVTFIAPDPPTASAFSRITLSTGPECTPTHWHQGLCLIDQKKTKNATSLLQGRNVSGRISFAKEGEGKEGLDISIAWQSEDAGDRREQTWFLR